MQNLKCCQKLYSFKAFYKFNLVQTGIQETLDKTTSLSAEVMAVQNYPLALAVLVIDCILIANTVGGIQFTPEQSTNIQSAQTKLLAVAALAEGMSTNSYTKSLVSSINFRGKLNEARTKANEIETRLLGEDDAEGKAERISGALTGVSDGLVGMIGGIKDGDWVQGVQGALGKLRILISFCIIRGADKIL